jgi:uncharacterized protein with PIN domain
MTPEDKDKRIKELEGALQDFKKKYEKLRKEFEELKSSHAITVSNLKKALKIKANSKKTAKPVGAPNGHEGYTRHIPERIDYAKELNLNRCPYCNTKLGETQEIRCRHVTDISLTSKAINTRYDIHRKYCPKCHKIVEPEVPSVLPHTRFGLNLMLLVMYLKIGLRLPGNKVRDFC